MRGPLRKRESSLWEREANDWYQDPSWVSARLFEEETFRGTIWDPAAGGCNIVTSAIAAGFTAFATDIVQRDPRYGVRQYDFLSDGPPAIAHADNIVCNPPFSLCDNRKAGTYPWVELCLARATRKVALLLPSNWVQGDKRSRWLQKQPLRRVWFISPRPSMPPGHIIAAGQKPGNGTTDYCWLVFQHDYDGPAEIRWLRRTP